MFKQPTSLEDAQQRRIEAIEQRLSIEAELRKLDKKTDGHLRRPLLLRHSIVNTEMRELSIWLKNWHLQADKAKREKQIGCVNDDEKAIMLQYKNLMQDIYMVLRKREDEILALEAEIEKLKEQLRPKDEVYNPSSLTGYDDWRDDQRQR